MSLDKVTLTLHEAKEIAGLLGILRTLICPNHAINTEQGREMLDNIDKIRFILIKAKFKEGI